MIGLRKSFISLLMMGVRNEQRCLCEGEDAGVSPAMTWPLFGGLMKASISSSDGAFHTSIRRRRGFHNRPNSDGALIAA